MFPEKLYSLLTADRGRHPLAPIIIHKRASSAAASVTSSYTNDFDGRVILLWQVAALPSGGGAQTVSTAGLFVQTPSGDTAQIPAYLKYKNYASEDVAVAVTPGSLSWRGFVVIPPKWIINAVAGFSAGVAANTLDLDFMGVIIPQGTFKL